MNYPFNNNGLDLYSAFQSPKALYRNHYSFIPHSHRWWWTTCVATAALGQTDGSVAANVRQTAPPTTTMIIHTHAHEVRWVRCLAQGHYDRDWERAGFEPPTLWLLDDPLYRLSHCRPLWSMVEMSRSHFFAPESESESFDFEYLPIPSPDPILWQCSKVFNVDQLYHPTIFLFFVLY